MAVLLILAAVGLILVTYTGQGEKEDVAARTEAWAQAFCDRDGKALYAMYHPEHREDFYNISKVMSGPEDDYIGFGWSSPWPMGGEYHFEVDGDQSVITYSALTSEPHRWVWKEWLTWEKAEGEWFVTGETSVDYDQIHTAEEFKQAYGGQINGTPMDYGDVTEALDKLAAEDWGEDFRDPELAMEYLLNLQGGYGTVLAKDGVTTVVYTFRDKSQAAVIMEQPSGEGGAWRPVEIVPVPEEMNGERMAGGGGERRGSSSTEGLRESPENPFITVEDVVKFAGITDAGQVADLLQTIKMQPSQNQSDNSSENGALNRVESYRFSYNGEDYGLHISYMKDDGSLFYITLKRLSTGEFVNIYETPEAVEHYQITLAGEREIRQFFETHADMADYLTYRLPPELSNGGYLADLGNVGGGNLFLTSDPDGRERLEELARCADLDFIPSTWLAAGAVERYVGDWPERIFDNGILTRVGPPWNHTAYVSDPIHYIDCQAPAIAYEVAHDLYTEATLEDAQKAYGPIPKENRSSHMWYVFFAKEGCEEMYSISLNADLYDQEDLRRIARSVYFYDSAWTQTGNAKEKK